MGMLQTRRFCKSCEAKTLHARSVFPDWAGCLLTLLTVGLFLPIWVVIGVIGAFQPWRCQNCGQGRMM